MIDSRLSALSLLLLGSVCFGCTLEANPVDQESPGGGKDPLYQFPGSSLWPNGVVPVCWTTSSTQHTDFIGFAGRVKRVTEDALARIAKLTFTGWGTCPASPEGTIAMNIDDSFPNSDAGGFGSTTGLRTLRFGRDRTSDGAIFHQFGHELGFMDEFNRPDFADHDGCSDGDFPGGNAFGTPPDDESIMTETYCNTNRRLSPWDVVGIQNAYGRKVAGAIVTLQGRCVDIPGNTTASVPLEVYDCGGGANQIWRRQSDGTLRATISGQARCMDVRGNTTSPRQGTVVQPFTCQGGPNQVWEFKDVAIVGIGGKCLDVEGGGFANNGKVSMYACQGGVNQRWTVQPDGTIRAGNTNFCLDVPGGVGSSGLDLEIYQCHGGANQRFTFTSGGEIKFGSLCMDSEFGDVENSRRVQLYECKSQTDLGKVNQRYYLRGMIRGLNGQCLQARTDANRDVINNNTLEIYPCTLQHNQIWDYYF